MAQLKLALNTRGERGLENPQSLTPSGRHDLNAIFHGRMGSTLPFFPHLLTVIFPQIL